MPERLLEIMAEERIPQYHDEQLIYQIAGIRCSRVTGQWPCETCVRDVASVVRDIERTGYELKQSVGCTPK